jgi:SAM-dependent methyltransferase
MEGWQGWDAYARYYDWENARTLGRRDVPFWRRLATSRGGRTLELGCGTGRVLVPLARAGVPIIGVDRSAAMLARARRRLRRLRRPVHAWLVLADVRRLPLASGSLDTVLAPYGLLQSLLSDTDLDRALGAVAGVLRRGGVFAADLVPDLPRWREYERRVSLRGTGLRRGTHLTLVETVRQDRARHLTIFDQEYVERRGRSRSTQRFSLVFRTLSMPELCGRLARAGFRVDALHGDYAGGAWREDADTWLVLATRG